MSSHLNTKMMSGALVVGACLLPLGVTLFLHVIWPGKGKPVYDRDLTPERIELVPKANAFYVLEKGAKRLHWPEENRPQIAGMAESNPRWEWSTELATNLLARNQAALAVLDEVLALGKLQGYKGNPEAGVFPAQAFTCDDFVALQKEYGFPGGMLEMDSEYKRARDHSAFVAPVGGVGA